MKKAIYFISFSIMLIGIVGCIATSKIKHDSEHIYKSFSKVEIEHLLQDSTLNIRALEILRDHAIAASSKGDFYKYLKTSNTFGKMTFANSDEDYKKPNNYRSIAAVMIHKNLNSYFALSIGSPAKLFNDGKLVYQEDHEKAFYDSMDFWNNKEGIAIGDSIYGCLSIIITRDGGNTWHKLSCEELPKAKENEGAFAASDTNIAIVGDKTWIATTTGRIYYSEDKGLNWEVIETPIIKAKETEGIYSIDFYDELNGFAIGGDYTKPADSSANKIRTQDGGKTWQLVAKNQSPGYRSCVQYIPNRAGQELVAIGFKGIDYSSDSGTTWSHLSDEGFYTIRFLNDSTAYAAGRGRISKLTFKE